MKTNFYLSILFLLILGCQPADKADQSQPNILILFTDDQRFNTIGAWGNDEIHTPNMDRLAEMGVSFTRAHIPGGNNGAVCMPSRAMLLTGRFYQHLPLAFTNMGAVTENRGVSPYPTFGETFKAAGYQTFFTGKWHNGRPELHDGFTAGGNIYLGGMHFLKDGGHYGPWLHDFDPSGEYPNDQRWQGDKFSSELYADAAVEFVNQKAEQPFLMYVSFTSPHDPRQAPEEYQAMYDPEEITLPPNFLPEHPFDNGMIRVRDEDLAPYPRTPERIKEEVAGYYAMVSEVDAQIGRILDALEQQGQLENTIVVFAGDNGLAVGQHGLLGKQNIYDHSIRVPLIIAGPGIKANQQSNTLCYLLDVFPTLCELTGVDAPESIEGKSLVPALETPATSLRDDVFLSFIETQRGIRTADNWKLIHYFVDGKSTKQLFNLNDDPWETQNLINEPQYQEQKERLEERLLEYLIEMEDEFLEPALQVEYTGFGIPATITLEHAIAEAQVYYTLDGSEPTTNGNLYTTPFALEQSGVIKARTFYENKPISKTVETQAGVVDQYEKITWVNEPAARYAARGKFSLVDGIRGSDNFKDGHWLGFHGFDLETTLQLTQKTSISSLESTFLENVNDWIFPPRSFTMEVSTDGQTFREVFHQDIPPVEADPGKGKKLVIQHQFNPPVEATHVKIRAVNTGVCPDWHSGAGEKAWLFVDEVKID